MTNGKYELREVTPKAMDCLLHLCPAIYEVTSKVSREGEEFTTGRFYMIIGEQITPEKLKKAGLETLAERIGKGEAMVGVPADLIDKRERS